MTSKITTLFIRKLLCVLYLCTNRGSKMKKWVAVCMFVVLSNTVLGQVWKQHFTSTHFRIGQNYSEGIFEDFNGFFWIISEASVTRTNLYEYEQVHLIEGGVKDVAFIQSSFCVILSNSSKLYLIFDNTMTEIEANSHQIESFYLIKELTSTIQNTRFGNGVFRSTIPKWIDRIKYVGDTVNVSFCKIFNVERPFVRTTNKYEKYNTTDYKIRNANILYNKNNQIFIYDAVYDSLKMLTFEYNIASFEYYENSLVVLFEDKPRSVFIYSVAGIPLDTLNFVPLIAEIFLTSQNELFAVSKSNLIYHIHGIDAKTYFFGKDVSSFVTIDSSKKIVVADGILYLNNNPALQEFNIVHVFSHNKTPIAISKKDDELFVLFFDHQFKFIREIRIGASTFEYFNYILSKNFLVIQGNTEIFVIDLRSYSFKKHSLLNQNKSHILVGDSTNDVLIDYCNKKISMFNISSGGYLNLLHTINIPIELAKLTINPADKTLYGLSQQGDFCTISNEGHISKLFSYPREMVGNMTVFQFDDYGGFWFNDRFALKHVCFSDGILSHSYSLRQGLPSTAINQVMCYQDSVVALTKSGLTVFYDIKKSKKQKEIRIEIVKIHINNEELINSTPQNFHGLISDITFFYAASTMKNDGRNIYATRLQGFADNWFYSEYPYTHFGNLPPGYYTFEVRFVNEFNDLSEHYQSISFFVKPRWYETLTFKLIAIISFIFIIVIVFYFNNKFLKMKKQVVESEIKILRSQINPHFLFNSFVSLQHLILNESSEKAEYYLTMFAAFFRKVFDTSRNSDISIHDEVVLLTKYLELERLRTRESFGYKITIDDNIHDLNVYIPTFIIQPFVENAVWHGVSSLDNKAGLIDIRFNVIHKYISIEIEDNGCGFESNLNQLVKQNRGIGVTTKRIRKMKGCVVKITNLKTISESKNGTLVEILIKNL